MENSSLYIKQLSTLYLFPVVPAIDDTVCGKPPVIPNGRLTDEQHVNKEDSTVAVVCEEGFIAQVQNLTCTNGEWSSFGKPLRDICKCESCVSQWSGTHWNG